MPDDLSYDAGHRAVGAACPAAAIWR